MFPYPFTNTYTLCRMQRPRITLMSGLGIRSETQVQGPGQGVGELAGHSLCELTLNKTVR